MLNQPYVQTRTPEVGSSVVAAGKDYLFALKDEHRTMCKLADELLASEAVERDDRMYVSSLDPKRLTTEQWLLLVRSHWGVENQNHHTLDTAFEQDDRPWIEADANGMLAVLLLRRIAYTLPALYRAVTLRSDKGRATPWKDLLQSVRDVLVAAAEEQRAGLRLREVAAVTR